MNSFYFTISSLKSVYEKVYPNEALEVSTLPTPEAAKYNNAGAPKPPAPTTKIDDFNRFACPALHKHKKVGKFKTKKKQDKHADKGYLSDVYFSQ